MNKQERDPERETERETEGEREINNKSESMCVKMRVRQTEWR